jgi:hypothetical protein
MTPAGPVWALTTYYNPAGYRRRLLNYKEFKKRLNVPLLTVELSTSGSYELSESDADILVRVPANSILWQKERLLNVGIEKLPPEARFVAWLDCDVIFHDGDWFRKVPSVLESMLITQCFSDFIDLPKDILPESLEVMPEPDGHSVAHLVSSGLWSIEDFRPPTTIEVRYGAPGLAWAGRREVIQSLGFYDAMILGSGDRALASAAYGRFDDAIFTARLSPERARHYLRWAEPFYAQVQGRVGVIEGRLFHLWHGDLEDRRYLQRHKDLAQLNFDPNSDIRIGKDGPWEWTTTSSKKVRDLVRDYFKSRHEDGRLPQPHQD